MEGRRESSGGCASPLSVELEVEAASEAATLAERPVDIGGTGEVARAGLEPESRTNETSPVPASTADSTFLPPSEGVEVTAEVADCGAEASSDPTDLTQKIVRQVEYYFSDENLPTDKFMLKYVKKNKEGYVPISVISSFRKMKKLVHDDDAVIVAALQTSSMLVVSKEGKRVKRLHPLPPPPEVEDRRACTVVVENLPEDYSVEILQKTFTFSGQYVYFYPNLNK